MTLDDAAELFREVGMGKAAAVGRMLRYRPELSRACDANGLSVLQFARYMRRDGILEMLIAAGPPLDIFEAAMIDRVDTLREIIGTDVAAVHGLGKDGLAALHVAAAYDSADTIQLMVDHGAFVDARACNGRDSTPLHLSAGGGHERATRALLRCGADPNARERDGTTPLMLAGAIGHREIAELLMARNANFDLRNARGETAAEVAAARGHRELAARLRLGERIIDWRTIEVRTTDGAGRNGR